MADLVTLKTRPVQTNEDAIALLREYLEMAENGVISSVAIAAIEPSGASRTKISQTDNFQELLGALAILQFRMIAERNRE